MTVGDKVRRLRGSRAVGTILEVRLAPVGEWVPPHFMPIGDPPQTPAEGLYYLARVRWAWVMANVGEVTRRTWIRLDRLQPVEGANDGR